MNDIKAVCPPEITYNVIRAVLTYTQIRDHLSKLGLPYEEFEDLCTDDIISECNRQNEENSALKMLLNVAREIENDTSFNSGNETQTQNSEIKQVSSVILEDQELECQQSTVEQIPAAKRQKTDVRDAILRSPSPSGRLPSPSGSSDSDATVDLDFDCI